MIVPEKKQWGGVVVHKFPQGEGDHVISFPKFTDLSHASCTNPRRHCASCTKRSVERHKITNQSSTEWRLTRAWQCLVRMGGTCNGTMQSKRWSLEGSVCCALGPWWRAAAQTRSRGCFNWLNCFSWCKGKGSKTKGSTCRSQKNILFFQDRGCLLTSAPVLITV